jgi:DNA gyrase/topoisomerase IV subunit A
MELGVLVSRSRSAESTTALTDARLQVGELQQALSRSEERNWTYYREREALKAELARARSTQTTSPPTTDQNGGTDRHTYADGVYAVGEDISPGTYHGVVTGKVGYWARLKNTTGMVDGIIANAAPRGPFVLTIYPTDEAVELRGVRLTAPQ